MSHDGKMRRGKISTDPTNIDRIYFLEQSKPKKVVVDNLNDEPLEPKPKKKEKKDGGD